MKGRVTFRAVRPFISAVIVIASTGALIYAIFFSHLDMQWITFLAGILVAAMLAEATRIARVEWLATLRAAKLSVAKEKLEHEIQLRKRAEATIAASKSKLLLIDEVLPTMIAFIDTEGDCQYQNRSFAEWLHLRPEQIKGQPIRKVLGATIYQETATSIRQSLDGHHVHYERTQTMPDGAVYRLQVEHIPQFGEDGKVTGFYMLINDITAPGDIHAPSQPDSSLLASAPAYAQEAISSQDSFVDSFSEQVSGQTDVLNIKAAIEKGDFQLFCQLISPIPADSGEPEHYEILVRLLEEEEGMMPPGAFFPLAEKYGLMLHLDRWVVQHVADWASRQQSPDEKKKNSMFFINVSGNTIENPDFPRFLQKTLTEYGVPSASLCFEIPNSELSARTPAVAEFARRVRQIGCRVAISGFGQDRISFDLIRGFQVEFLKIDGGIILDILRDPVDLAKVTAINTVAKKIGVKTIAELVESEETIAKLKEIGIDFAQGFGISRPRPLAEE
jgi:PAS domain S-box-containing protein